jgi:hypothetical protein
MVASFRNQSGWLEISKFHFHTSQAAERVLVTFRFDPNSQTWIDFCFQQHLKSSESYPSIGRWDRRLHFEKDRTVVLQSRNRKATKFLPALQQFSDQIEPVVQRS